ncbi:unnamed protein product [Dicrocoelium dendriticum]|nr:unnamed protein product [Dicrocoelium dendriticum]
MLFAVATASTILSAIFRDSTDQNSDDSQSLDAFLADILGTVSPDTEHDNLPTTHPVSASSESHVFNTTPAFSHTVFDRYKSLATCSVYTTGSASHDLCSGSSISTNCLLPRYLADNFKRANDHRSNRLRPFRLPPYTKLPERSTVKSGDSGVSLSSLASPSYSDSYEEHLKQRAQLTPSCFPIKPQSDVAGSTGYRKRTSLVPLVDRMITNQKKRLPEC